MTRSAALRLLNHKMEAKPFCSRHIIWEKPISVLYSTGCDSYGLLEPQKRCFLVRPFTNPISAMSDSKGDPADINQQSLSDHSSTQADRPLQGTTTVALVNLICRSVPGAMDQLGECKRYDD